MGINQYFAQSWKTLTANQTGTGVAGYNHGKRVLQSWVGWDRISYLLICPNSFTLILVNIIFAPPITVYFA